MWLDFINIIYNIKTLNKIILIIQNILNISERN